MLSIQSSGTKYSHIVVQASPPSAPKTLCLWNDSRFLPCLATPFCVLQKWRHTAFVLCEWLISLSSMFSRAIHVEAGVSIPFFVRRNNVPLHVWTTFVYPFMCLWTFGLFPLHLSFLSRRLKIRETLHRQRKRQNRANGSRHESEKYALIYSTIEEQIPVVKKARFLYMIRSGNILHLTPHSI